MSLDIPAYMAAMREFLANRATVSIEELEKYAGKWVAWSPDGTHVAAAAAGPELLDALLEANGYDPAQCVVEGLPDDDSILGEVDGSAA